MTDAMAVFQPEQMTGLMKAADQLARSALIPRALQNKPGDVLVVLLTGREFGLGPMQALRSIHVVEGKPTMGADLMVGLCLARREVCEFFTLVESTAQSATYKTKRHGAAEVAMTWTMEQAKAAGVAGKDNWRKYPDAMLRARCASALARAVYPDLLAGTYDPDELDVPAPAATEPAAKSARTSKAEKQAEPQTLPAEAPTKTLERVQEPKPAEVQHFEKPQEKQPLTPDQRATADRVAAQLGGKVEETEPGSEDEALADAICAEAEAAQSENDVRALSANAKKLPDGPLKARAAEALKAACARLGIKPAAKKAPTRQPGEEG